MHHDHARFEKSLKRLPKEIRDQIFQFIKEDLKKAMMLFKPVPASAHTFLLCCL